MRLSAKASALSLPDDELMRQWYLENYRHESAEAVSGIASQVRQKMILAGISLFERVFSSSEPGRRIWRAVAPKLASTRIEVRSRGPALPWEQVRPNSHDPALGLACRALVHGRGSGRENKLTVRAGVVRILLAICRPGLSADIDFRAVARLLIDNPAITASARLRFEVLRPPTFERLKEVLKTAAAEGRPYHVVHFDGHGEWRLASDASRSRGYLIFENHESGGPPHAITGEKIGRALRRGRVPVLVMNACRSAFVPWDSSEPSEAEAASVSLSQEVVATGASAVAAMRYNVDVRTAASFMGLLYESIAEGGDLSEAFGRSLRRLDASAAELQMPDAWQLPVLVEKSRVRFQFPPQSSPVPESASAIAPEDGMPEPLSGELVGQDFAVFMLDRFLSANSLAALIGAPGTGKTAVACEFARWFRTSGGLSRVSDDSLPVIAYRDLAAFPSFSAFETEILRVVPDRIGLLVIDNFSSGFSGAKAGEEAARRRDMVERLIGLRCKVLLVQRHREGPLPAFEGLYALQLRRLEPEPCTEFAAGLLHASEIDCRPLIPQWTQACRWLPGVVTSVLEGARQSARKKAVPLHVALGTMLTRFENEGLFGEGVAPPADWSSVDAAFSPGERELLGPLALFRGFAQGMVLSRINEIVRNMPKSDGAGEFGKSIEGLLERLAARSLVEWWGAGGFGIHPLARPVFVRWLLPGGEPLSALSGTPHGKQVLGAFCDANADLATWYRGLVAGEADRESLSRLRFECENLIEARRHAIALRRFDWIIRLTEGIRLVARATGQAQIAFEDVANVDQQVRTWASPDAPAVSPDEWASWLEMKAESFGGANLQMIDAVRRERYRFCKQWAGPFLREPRENWSREARHAVEHYASSLSEFSLTFAPDDPGQVRILDEALRVASLARTPELESDILLALARSAYGSPPQEDVEDGDLKRSAQLTRSALKLVPERTHSLIRSRCWRQLAAIETKRFYRCARADNLPKPHRLRKIRTWLERSLEECRHNVAVTSHSDFSDIYDELGYMARVARDPVAAELNFRQAILHAGLAGQAIRAAEIKRNLGVALADLGMKDLGGEYIRAAIVDFRIYPTPDRDDEIATSIALLEKFVLS